MRPDAMARRTASSASLRFGAKRSPSRTSRTRAARGPTPPPPHHAVLRWRYGAQLDWRLALIGLAESGADYDARGYAPGSGARGYLRFREYGMPFDTQPRERNIGTGRACRAIVAARLAGSRDRDPGVPRAAVRPLHDDDAVRHRRGDPRRARRAAAGGRRSWPRSTTRRQRRPTRPTAPRSATRAEARPSSRARQRTRTAPSATPRRR